MAKMGSRKHLKRYKAPAHWPIHPKEDTWTVKPSPGPHAIEDSLPLLLVVRDILELADTSREAKMIINQGDILVAGTVRKDYKFPVGFMDVIQILKTGKTYRVLPDEKGRLVLHSISAENPGVQTVPGVEQDPAKSAINTFTLDNLKPEACVFHRNRDGTLIRLLWNKLFPNLVSQNDFVLVLPFCSKDCNIALKNVEWMRDLNPSGYVRDVILAYDSKTPADVSTKIESVSKGIFKHMTVFKYPRPKLEGWPFGPNYALQSTANYIHHSVKRPWFWMEADMIPLHSNWLKMLSDEYLLCDKPFMGPIIENLGHMNGCGVYPFDFPLRCPSAMKATSVAWDYAMKDEMVKDCHDASHVIQHFWGMQQGKPHYHIGQAPSFRNGENMQFVNRSCAVLHRCKDGSLIDQLRSETKKS